MTVNHWHVTRHSEDDDAYVTETIFSALDYAKTTLDELADMEHSMVSDVASRVEADWSRLSRLNTHQGEMFEALLSFAKAERYNGLMANAANMVKQNSTCYADRAPLYQVNSADWVGRAGNELADARDAADARLHQAALHIVREINSSSPLGIWDCSAELLTWPESDPMHGGESYCADEYPDGYAGYQDGPCGDR